MCEDQLGVQMVYLSMAEVHAVEEKSILRLSGLSAIYAMADIRNAALFIEGPNADGRALLGILVTASLGASLDFLL